MKALLYILLLILFLPPVSEAQDTAQARSGSIRGQVTDKQTSKPVEFALVTVLLNGVTKGAVYTEEDGSYEIKGLAPGSYKIIIQEVNHRALTILEIVKAGETTCLDARMEERPPVDLDHHTYKPPIINATDNIKTFYRHQIVKWTH